MCSPDIQETSQFEQFNRREYFPEIIGQTTLAEGERVFGSNYMQIVRSVYEMEDGFGLCALIAGLGVATQVNPQYWKQVCFEPQDIIKEARNRQITPLKIFIDQFYRGDMATRAEDLKVTTSSELTQILNNLKSGQGLLAFTLAFFPKENAVHTHVLGTTQSDGNKIQIFGDLSPFGLRETVAVTVTPESLTAAMTKVIGFGPNTDLANRIAEMETKEGRQQTLVNKTFQYNACIWSGLDA